ncbi:hypothetical protein P152DRAFT_63461 [Eremomyces bilateralis CBS 781.70]|uniref:Uncharacterized protein n=1 Tax=Eremomyces bilateralis CBS 781.70 TaxID=1392243 RepID=A0A6G1FZA1_9PEZI|nr:uncharacterized protein P152DRAFT_63461 [Eremomyces bilateralis CBS 781.70]KAF1811177.1 hypothetical protein P152DRAFT_63461 [Eremomyces bilateralis CBS 781.70]
MFCSLPPFWGFSGSLLHLDPRCVTQRPSQLNLDPLRGNGTPTRVTKGGGQGMVVDIYYQSPIRTIRWFSQSSLARRVSRRSIHDQLRRSSKQCPTHLRPRTELDPMHFIPDFDFHILDLHPRLPQRCKRLLPRLGGKVHLPTLRLLQLPRQ